MKANEFAKRFGWEKSKMAVKKLLPMEDGMPVFDYNSEDLKRLVESYELVESYGGLFEAKIYADSEYRSLSVPQITKRLKQAILDVESCND